MRFSPAKFRSRDEHLLLRSRTRCGKMDQRSFTKPDRYRTLPLLYGIEFWHRSGFPLPRHVWLNIQVLWRRLLRWQPLCSKRDILIRDKMPPVAGDQGVRSPPSSMAKKRRTVMPGLGTPSLGEAKPGLKLF
ncbi:hypothetical protein BRADI_2g47665v3 [Brachypodium distachyon]|uniref:Uncharacterized protein n=1 Tax=Brachypodium distachyon TaxID=15368 RepID=A0A0Q3KEH4_BRADI|nr:hypothetical protein BRADI_2g47665v3 [Brachypodium distachyon]